MHLSACVVTMIRGEIPRILDSSLLYCTLGLKERRSLYQTFVSSTLLSSSSTQQH
jgi:hypothetical protein